MRWMFLLLVLFQGTQSAREIRIEDDSDWWSLQRNDEIPEGVKPSRGMARPLLFKIAGITLGAEPAKITKLLGRAIDVSRGDASTGRNQNCYVSQSGETHLIFEWGEVDSAVYLFSDGKKWNGS